MIKKPSKIVIIIPARLASKRLPNKPLADILGESMISRVYKQAKKANLGEVYVACDCQEIANEIQKIGGKSIITDPDLPSGTDRIFAAFKEIKNYQDVDIVVNLQGDLPAIDVEVIREAALAAIESDESDIATVASIIKDSSEIHNPNVVKIAISSINKDKLGEALYFSRSAIPYNAKNYYHHIGIYAYKVEALKKFVSLRPGDLEQIESLEQLRALENKIRIVVKIVDSHPLSVDTKEDLEEIKKFIKTKVNLK